MPTQQLLRRRSRPRFQELWERLDIRYDRFIRTTDELHKRGRAGAVGRGCVKAKTPDGRDAIYTGTYAGWYCPRCEAFKDEEELKQPGNLCPDHERPCEWTEEENFFFRLSAYARLAARGDRVGRAAHRPRGAAQRGAGGSSTRACRTSASAGRA